MSRKPVSKQLEENVQQAVEGAKEEVTAARRPWYEAIHWGFILLVVYAVQLTLFALLAFWVHIHPILPVDVAITQEFQESQSPWLRFTMLAVSYLGSNAILFSLLVLLTALVFWELRLRLEALVIISLSVVSSVLNGVIKLLVARPRPKAPLVEILQVVNGQSFPSGHVMSYLAYFGLLFSLGIILFRGKRWWRMALLIIPAFFVVMVGPSRIYLGAHWASDVLGAYLIGGVLLGIALWLYLRLKRKGVLATKGRGEKPV
jgi:membrane-associated phospholipid phosphatase